MKKWIYIALAIILLLSAVCLVWYFCAKDNDQPFVPGLYEPGAVTLYAQGKTDELSDMLIMSWDDLIAQEVILFKGGRIYTEYEIRDEQLINSSAAKLNGDLILPNDGTITHFGYADLEGRTAFAGCTKLTGIYIPSSVIELCDSTFYGCAALTTAHFPLDCKITSLGLNNFRGCSSLCEIRLPDSIELIGENAFMDCTSLQSVTFGTYCTLSKIQKNAFSGCSSMKQITFPASLTLASAPVFAGCSSLETVEFLSPLYLKNDFFSTNSITTIIFNCNPPLFMVNTFEGLTATVYYPADNPAWIPEMLQSYGGTITWCPLNG